MMSRATSLIVAVLCLATLAEAQVGSTVWRKSAKDTTLPRWFSGSGSTERGLAYGKVGGNDRLYVVSRNGGSNTVILNAHTGDSVGVLRNSGITGGTFAVSDVEVSSNGVIYVSNLTTASATSAFKVYRYTTEADSPTVALSYTTTGSSFRLGDKFTIVGSTADNSAQLIALTSGNDSALVFTTSDNGATFSYSTGIALSDGNLGTSPMAVPFMGGWLVNSSGQSLKYYGATGTLTGTVPGSVVPTGSNALRYVEQKGRKLVITYASGSGNENFRVADISNGVDNAILYYVSESLGSSSNTNGAGDVAVRFDADTLYVYVIGTNNGLGAYKLVPGNVVTFNLNTSSVVDTTKPSTVVQVRGSFTGWGDASPRMTNIGGDYWTLTTAIVSGSNIMYKYFVTGAENGGWETTNDRPLAVTKDTVLPVQFWSRTAPVYQVTDSIDVWFRLNVAALEDFNPSTDTLSVRGSFNSWADGNRLSREGASRFYSGQVKVPPTDAGAKEYKFVWKKPTGTTWEWDGLPNPNRMITINKDTTVYWKWWEDRPYTPPVVADTFIITFNANMARAISERGFSIGDTIEVRTGFNSTAAETRTKRLSRVGVTTIHAVTDTVVVSKGKNLNYQYYVVKGGVDFREIYFDFSFEDPSNSAAERRRVLIPASGNTLTVQDTATSSVASRRVPRFRNTRKLTQAVTVTYTVDVRPAIYTLLAGKKLRATNITPHVLGSADSVRIWGVWMNGPAVGGWDVRGGWGPDRRADTLSKMYDDGTHGDAVSGDSVYSLRWSYTTNDVVGQEFKFGIGGFDNEGGFGNNHIENVDDSGPTSTIPSQFGSIDPIFYNAWDFDNKRPATVTSVDAGPVVPLVYSLGQNYPNPFNPSTAIQFSLPKESDVTLKVFNTLGQEVATVTSGKMNAGTHTVTFDASRLATGIYFYQIKAGDFTSIKKMVLIK